MDNKRFYLAAALSMALLMVFQHFLPHPPAGVHGVAGTQVAQNGAQNTKLTPATETVRQPGGPASPGNLPDPAVAQTNAPRLTIDAPLVQGSMSLLGARLDKLVTKTYHETIDPHSPLFPLLVPASDKQPTYVQFGWSAEQAPGQAPGQAAVRVPGSDTLWTSSGGALTDTHPVTLSWDNGAGLTFQIALAVDDHYMFDVKQTVINKGAQPVSLHPWTRIRRDYTPTSVPMYLLHEGLVGMVDGHLQEMTYVQTKGQTTSMSGRLFKGLKVMLGEADEQAQPPGPRVAFSGTSHAEWAGITDKYMLTALIPDADADHTVSYRYLPDDGADRYQVDSIRDVALVASPGGQVTSDQHLFSGAKEVHLLDRYEHEYAIPNFDKAVDFGLFYFLTKPIFYALDWLNHLLGNFGLAILAFTIVVKILFFPLANYSFRSMAKMKMLGPKVTAMRERNKDDPVKFQQEMMTLYREEGVNPASGCLPMLVQIPVFFSLYKDIYISIEMWHQPFYGWIKDLSAPDPTNIFNLFGLLPFDPSTWYPILHLGIWPAIMGCTMLIQQRLNPPPPDPVQAKIFRFLPLVFMFMLGRFPAGLVIYWSWNNTLTIAQQWLIQRTARLPKPLLART